MELHGLLVVDKPRGLSSHDVVARVRRLLRQKRVGHAGTLDPAAEGVLVLGIGRATQLLDAVQGGRKTYLARIVFGAGSISGDIEGPLTDVSAAVTLDLDSIQAATDRFIGEIGQVPPAHSAVKVGGQPAYRRAHQGEVVELPSRRATIFRITQTRWIPPELDLEVECSAGTYIRSLARDIGEALGVPAYLHALLRARSGAFSIDDAWTLPELEALLSPATFSAMALHPWAALRDSPALLLDREQETAWYHGRPIASEAHPAHVPLAFAFGADGCWVGVARQQADAAGWQPRLVVGRA